LIRRQTENYKKPELSQGNRAMPHVIYFVDVRG